MLKICQDYNSTITAAQPQLVAQATCRPRKSSHPPRGLQCAPPPPPGQESLTAPVPGEEWAAPCRWDARGRCDPPESSDLFGCSWGLVHLWCWWHWGDQESINGLHSQKVVFPNLPKELVEPNLSLLLSLSLSLCASPSQIQPITWLDYFLMVTMLVNVVLKVHVVSCCSLLVLQNFTLVNYNLNESLLLCDLDETCGRCSETK